MQIFIHAYANQTITLDVESADTVANAKCKIENKLGIPTQHQHVHFGGRELDDGDTLAAHNICRESTLQLLLRLRGGMFSPGRDNVFDPFLQRTRAVTRSVDFGVSDHNSVGSLGANYAMDCVSNIACKQPSQNTLPKQPVKPTIEVLENPARKGQAHKDQAPVPPHPARPTMRRCASEKNVKKDVKQGVSVWWRAEKASCCAQDFGSLAKAVEHQIPPPMPYPIEHSSTYTYTSRDTPAKLLSSLCFALVYADVQISNKAQLLAGECWIIRGFFFAMYHRTCLDISVFTSGTDGELLVEMQRAQGDRGACIKLCAHLQQQCRLSAYMHAWGANEYNISNANTTDPPKLADDSKAHTYPTWDFSHPSLTPWDSAHEHNLHGHVTRGSAKPALQPQDPETHKHFDTDTDTAPKCSDKRISHDISREENPEISPSMEPPRHPLNLHLCNSHQPLPLPASVLERCKIDKNKHSMQLLRCILRLQTESEYHETKLAFWQDIAGMTTTDPNAALHFLNLCIESCNDNHEAKVLDSMATLLHKGDYTDSDLQYCVLASLFNAVQAAQRNRLSLLHPTVLCPMAKVMRAATKFTDPRYGQHLRVHAVGLMAWFTLQQAVASISCGAVLPIALPKYTNVDGLKKGRVARDVLSDADMDRNL